MASQRKTIHPAVAARTLALLAAWLGVAAFEEADAGTRTLAEALAPVDNPLKGFLPYAGRYTNFPHSLEWFYLPLKAVMLGSNQFDWTALETRLNAVAGRGNQSVFRFYLDYPGQPSGIPDYLLAAGLLTRRYPDHGNNGISVSPDYENPQLRSALTNFIHRLGARYDGDPRIGFITVGLLGFWGEWHTYPYSVPPSNWFASVTVQDEVLDAFQAAFQRTRWLLRQPYGTRPELRPMGYHDDSFAYSTIPPPAWHFLGALQAAGETNKWRTQPIGGEIRPELQSCLWSSDLTNCPLPAQDYEACVTQTHATWLLNHAAFEPGFQGMARERALAGARRLGYEFHVAAVSVFMQSNQASIEVALRNRGVAPFYYDWPVELGALREDGTLLRTWSTDWTLRGLLPAATNTLWRRLVPRGELPTGALVLALRVVHPLAGGKPLRFANVTQDQHRAGWLSLGRFTLVPPGLRAEMLANGDVRLWADAPLPPDSALETSPDMSRWTVVTTNLSLTNAVWTLPVTSLTHRAFFRLALPPE